MHKVTRNPTTRARGSEFGGSAHAAAAEAASATWGHVFDSEVERDRRSDCNGWQGWRVTLDDTTEWVWTRPS